MINGSGREAKGKAKETASRTEKPKQRRNGAVKKELMLNTDLILKT